MTMTGTADGYTAAAGALVAQTRGAGAHADALAVRIFGPLTITRGQESLPLRSVKQRRLLGLLALHPGRAVSHEEIARTLWDGVAPEAARSLIHTYVARLRGVVGTEVVGAEPGGYRLELAAEQLDLLQFEALSERASAEAQRRPQAALDLYGRALSIARGTLLADLTETFAAHPALVVAAQRRVAVALAHADCAVRLGQCARAVPYLRALLAAEPLHEALGARLMTALAGSGQRDAAFELYRSLHARLREELGVVPGRELTEARALILAGKEDCPAAPGRPRAATAGERRRPPAQLPPGISGFVGRAELLDELDRRLLPGAEANRLVVIGGAGGVGKTELAVRWARRAAAHFPDGQLFLDLQGFSQLRPVTPLAALTGMLRALGVPVDRIPSGQEEAAALYRAEAADRRLLIVLDNAHGAEQIRPLIPGSAGSAVLVTSRDCLDELAAGNGAQPIAVNVLRTEEAVDLLGRMLGRACTAQQARRLAQACGRLPLALRIAAAHLEGRPSGFVESYLTLLETHARLRAPAVSADADATVRAAFAVSYEALQSPEQELFRLLGLMPGADFGAGAAAALAGIGLEEAEHRLDRLCAAHLALRGREGRYALHDLLRAYARSLAVASGPVEAPVHRLAAWYLAAVRAACQAAYPHALRLPDEPCVPVRGSFADADAARAWLDAEHPNIVAVIEQAAGHGAPGEAWRLAFVYRPHLMARWLGGAMVEAGATALAAAREAGDELGEAASRIALAAAAETMGDLAAAAEHLHRGADLSQAVSWDEAQAVALNNLGLIKIQDGRLDEAAAAFRHNIADMRASGNKDGEALALTNLGLVLTVAGRLREGVDRLREALRMRALVGPRNALVTLRSGLGAAYRDLGEPGRAREELLEAVRVGRETGEPFFTCAAEATLVGVACDLGEYAEARDRLEHTWVLVEAIGLDKLAALAALHAGSFELVQGSAEAARGWYDRVLSYGESAGDPWHTARALVGIAACERAAGRPGPAVRAGVRALRCAEKSGHRLQIADAHGELARTHAAFGGRDRAPAHARIGAEVARDCGYRAGLLAAERVLEALG